MRPLVSRSRAAAPCARSRSALPAAAEDYPSRPIRVIASQGAGGLSDVWMRAVADELGPVLGGSVVVENRTGAGGTIGARACADAAPDGYTFCILPAEPLHHNPHHLSDRRLRSEEESRAGHQGRSILTQVFAVNASLGVKNVRRARRATPRPTRRR